MHIANIAMVTRSTSSVDACNDYLLDCYLDALMPKESHVETRAITTWTTEYMEKRKYTNHKPIHTNTNAESVHIRQKRNPSANNEAGAWLVLNLVSWFKFTLNTFAGFCWLRLVVCVPSWCFLVVFHCLCSGFRIRLFGRQWIPLPQINVRI